jgi:hypothetical protein
MRQTWNGAARRLVAIAALGLASGLAGAAVVSGSFASDDQLQLLRLRVDSPGTVGITSFGYGGGTTASGPVARGGFDTMLFLFNALGVLVAQSDDGLGAVVDPSTGNAADAGLSLALVAGLYTVVLAEYDNFPNGFNLADGFSRTGGGNFTPGLSGSCSAASFCDFGGNARTPNWTLEVVGATVLPEPASIALVGIAGLACGVARRRKPITA